MIEVYAERSTQTETKPVLREIVIPDADNEFACHVLDWARWALSQHQDPYEWAASRPQTETSSKLQELGLNSQARTDREFTDRDKTYWESVWSGLQANRGWDPFHTYAQAGGESFVDSETKNSLVLPISRYDIFCVRGLWLGIHAIMASESGVSRLPREITFIPESDDLFYMMRVHEVTGNELKRIRADREIEEKRIKADAIAEERRLNPVQE